MSTALPSPPPPQAASPSTPLSSTSASPPTRSFNNLDWQNYGRQAGWLQPEAPCRVLWDGVWPWHVAFAATPGSLSSCCEPALLAPLCLTCRVQTLTDRQLRQRMSRMSNVDKLVSLTKVAAQTLPCPHTPNASALCPALTDTPLQG